MRSHKKHEQKPGMKDVGGLMFLFLHSLSRLHVYFLQGKSQPSIKYELKMPLFCKTIYENYILLFTHMLPVN